jgi:hypothetical protein
MRRMTVKRGFHKSTFDVSRDIVFDINDLNLRKAK